MNDIPMADGREQKWISREGELLSEIDDAIKYYSESADWARIAHRTLGIVVLVGSVIAPIAVVSSSGEKAGLTLFKMDKDDVTRLAIIITVTLAFAEGLRRIFQFDQRWITCAQVRDQLKLLRGFYLDEQVAKPVGGEAWVAGLRGLRTAMQETLSQESTGYFERVKAASKVPENRGGEP